MCDLANSSKYLNDNQTADELESFLPRLYWTALSIVDAANGKFIKWTGDGFMAWFETPLHRTVGKEAAAVFKAASQLTMLINVTQLGLKPKKKFSIRHGVAYEQDALLIKLTDTTGRELLDLIGRAVVLAFRLSAIPARYPAIATQKDLVVASVPYTAAGTKFRKHPLSASDKLKYFKGERWGTDGIYVSDDRPPRVKSIKSVLNQAKKAINYVEAEHTDKSEDLEFATRFVNMLKEGPEWSQKVLVEYSRFLMEDLLGSLKSIVPVLEKVNRRKPSGNGGAA